MAGLVFKCIVLFHENIYKMKEETKMFEAMLHVCPNMTLIKLVIDP